MGYLEGFGYKIYRLKEVREVEEFLLYNINTKEYNQYSSKRLKEILQKEIIDLNIDWDKYVKEVLKLGNKEKV